MFIRYFTLLFIILSANLGDAFVKTSSNTAYAQVVPSMTIERVVGSSDAIPDPAPSGTELGWTVSFTNVDVTTLDITGASDQFAVCYSTDGGTTTQTFVLRLTGSSLNDVRFQMDGVTPVVFTAIDYNICTLSNASTIASSDGTMMNFTTLNSNYDNTDISTSAITTDANNYGHIPDPAPPRTRCLTSNVLTSGTPVITDICRVERHADDTFTVIPAATPYPLTATTLTWIMQFSRGIWSELISLDL